MSPTLVAPGTTVVPIALSFGLVLPTVLETIFGDVIGGFIYPGLVARLFRAFCCSLWMAN